MVVVVAVLGVLVLLFAVAVTVLWTLLALEVLAAVVVVDVAAAHLVVLEVQEVVVVSCGGGITACGDGACGGAGNGGGGSASACGNDAPWLPCMPSNAAALVASRPAAGCPVPGSSAAPAPCDCAPAALPSDPLQQAAVGSQACAAWFVIPVLRPAAAHCCCYHPVLLPRLL